MRSRDLMFSGLRYGRPQSCFPVHLEEEMPAKVDGAACAIAKLPSNSENEDVYRRLLSLAPVAGNGCFSLRL